MRADARRRWPPVYPILLALSLPVAVYADFAQLLPFEATMRTMVIAILVGTLVLALACLFVRDCDRAAAIAATVVLVIGWWYEYRTLVLAVAALLLLALALDALRRKRGRRGLSWPGVTRLASLAVTVFLITNIFSAVSKVEPWTAFTGPADAPVVVAAKATSDGPLPDVYLILLDGHPRPDVMADKLGLGDSLVTGLDELGFTVATNNRSNYTYTNNTLPTMWAGEYLDTLEAQGRLERDAEGKRWGWDLLQDAPFLDRFGAYGYRTTTLPTSYDHVSIRSFDEYIEGSEVRYFELRTLRLTLLGALIDRFAPAWPFDQARERIERQFDATAAFVDEQADEPRLLFTHIEAPHAPFLFRADGSAAETDLDIVSYHGQGPSMLRQGIAAFEAELAGQTAYIDERALETVGHIVAQDPDAIIALFSDHGHGWIRYTDHERGAVPGFGGMDNRTRNLLAVRDPRNPAVIEDDTTLVNLIGRLFASITGEPWTDRPDEIWDCNASASQCTRWDGSPDPTPEPGSSWIEGSDATGRDDAVGIATDEG